MKNFVPEKCHCLVHSIFQIDFDIMRQCKDCRHQVTVESRDPYESFVINRAFFDLIEEHGHFVKKDIRRAEK